MLCPPLFIYYFPLFSCERNLATMRVHGFFLRSFLISMLPDKYISTFREHRIEGALGNPKKLISV